MTTPRQTAAEAYTAAHADTLALLRRIEAELTAPLRNSTDGLHWGHVGDARARASALKEISDRLFQEGEYAPEGAAQQGTRVR